MSIPSLLIIGTNFPEPTTTAAGTRMMQLISLFQEGNYNVTFASTAKLSEYSFDLNSLNIDVVEIELNNSNFDDFVKERHPDIVMFDRFMAEEQFGWRVAEQCPNALRILDTEDLHFLRLAREEAVKRGDSVNEANTFSDTAKRELASILRCDLSLIISEFEMNLLQKTFNVPGNVLFYLPFLVTPVTSEEKAKLPSFDERDHFVTIGNMRHAPNKDAVLYLKANVWPQIRKRLPKAELHVYGAYESQQISQLHNPKEGFFIEGWAKDASEVLQKTRVCLAPLRFGAGLKGKILDSMIAGTPCVTTSIGAEGINADLEFCGGMADDLTRFVNLSVLLYSEKRDWLLAQRCGFKIIENRFDRTLFSEVFKNKIEQLRTNLDSHRRQHFMGQILLHQSLQSTKYMSKWIEEKNKQV